MENKSIWAKSKINKYTEKPFTLSEHTNDVFKAFESLKKNIPKELHQLIKLSIFLHDLGKCHPRFQLFALKNKDYLPFDISSNIYHSLFSVLWIDQKKLEEKIKSLTNGKSNDYLKIILSAVAYHHWKASIENQIRFGSDDFERFFEKTKAYGFVDNLRRNLELEVENFKEKFENIICINNEMLEGLSRGVSFAEYVIPPYQLYWLPKRQNLNPDDKINKDWIFISGSLIRSDHYASYCEENEEDVRNADIVSINYEDIISNTVKEIGVEQKKIWQISEAPKLKNNNVILIAPTGFGKTEFSFLWAGESKFFYTLPLRSAVNQIHNRAKKIFENSAEQKVGLLHSDADVYLIDDSDESENLKLYETSKQLSFPAIISTGDQFFPYALRPPGFEKIFATFSYSKLIIDEVQAYDPKSAAIIIKFIQDIVRMGGKFLLMTATIPSFIKEKLDELGLKTDEYDLKNIYEDKREILDNFCKHIIKIDLIENEIKNNKPDFILSDKVDDIILEAEKGQRVLVILNTVKQAQDIYDKIVKKFNQAWLLHSRFTMVDRRKLEIELCGDKKQGIVGEFQNPKPKDETTGKILIATQVVEASLDLDADVLFTELAPMDSLVQRMGRVLRRIHLDFDNNIINKNGVTFNNPGESNINIWVFQNGLESGNGRVYIPELLYKTLNLFSENNGNIDKIDIKLFPDKYKQKKEIVIEQSKNILNESTTKSKKKKNSAKKSSADIIIKDDSISISEYRKYKLVDDLYKNLNSRGYLKKFYDMLDILDSGYMSDRKEDAQKMFRDISTIQAIPLEILVEGKAVKTKDILKEKVENFFLINEKKDHLYTLFKKEIISDYVVNIHPKWNMQKDKVSEWVESELFEENRKLREKVSRWTKSIYFVNYGYNSKGGIGSEKKENDDNFL